MSRDGIATVAARGSDPSTAHRADGAGDASSETTTAVAATSGERMPLTWGQRGLWALQQMASTSPMLHIAIASRFETAVDPAVFDAALRAVVDRHAAWRSTFHATADGVEARVASTVDVAVREEIVAQDGGSDADPLAARLEALASAPFDLANGPLLRVVILRQGDEAYLLFVVHHLIADLWSLAVAMREVGAAYGRLVEGRPAAPSGGWPPAGDWRAHATADAEDDHDGGVDADFWHRHLASPPPPLALPADRPAPAMASFRGGVVHTALDADLTTRLRRFARQHGTTPLPVLLAVLQLLLARYTGQQEVVVGTPAAGRGDRSTRKLVGYLVRMVALRGTTDEDASFRDLVDRAHGVVTEALAHQAYPLPRLVEALADDGDARRAADGRSPFFRVSLAYQKAPRRGPAAAFGALSIGMAGVRYPLGPLTLESIALPTRTAQLDLTVLAAEVDGRLGLAFQYDADRFDHDSVGRWQRHFVTLLRSALETPEMPAARVPMFGREDRDRLLLRFNNTSRPIDLPTVSVEQLVARQVRARPEATAVVAPDGILTYGGLGVWAGAIAAHLSREGVGSEQVVGVLMPRSTWLPAALLGTWQAGAAYLQLDPELPAERLAFLVRDAGLAALVTVAALRDRVPESDAPILVAEELDLEVPGLLDEVPEHDLDRLAYLIYTSGSTGRPKGVAVAHRSLRNLIGWYHRAYALDPDHRVSQLAGLSFDATVFEMWPALAAGASLHLADDDTRVDPARLTDWLRQQGVTIAFLPTPVAEAYLRQPGAGAAPLQVLQAAGDRLHAFRPPGFAARLLNLYGPTESTVATTEGEVPDVDRATDVLPSIGHPIDNLRLYVVDARGRLVPMGAEGELWIGGAGVARGYHGQPGLTADRFRPDPWGAPGDRLYRTGDVVRHRRDGALDFRGRTDHQVKIRGVRIEPGEIEAALRTLDGVEDAVVEARGEGAARRLVAWVVAGRTQADPAPEAPHLAAALRRRLPGHLVPTDWVVLDTLPLTPNGKIDRRALPTPTETPGGGAPPRTPTETSLATLWRELLAVDHVGRDDDFFGVGGQSLLAGQLTARLRAEHGVEVSLRTVFEHPRLADLAAELDARRATVSDAATVEAGNEIDLRPRSADAPVPLSFAQERLWFLDQLHPGLVAYNIPAAVDLRGALQVAALHRALSALTSRHEVLRSRFVAVDGEAPVQIVEPPTPIALPVEDWTDVPAGERRAAVRARAADEAATAFDLASGPLMRATLLRCDEQHHVLLLTLHHSVGDGLSMVVLQRDLAALYRACLADGSGSVDVVSALPPLTIQYGDYAIGQRETAAAGAFDGALTFWRERLAGIPDVLGLPVDRPRPAVVDHAGDRVPVRVARDRFERLAALGRAHDATPFMTLLAAFDVVLARVTGEVDLVVGSPVGGRDHPALGDLIGLFVNLVPLRVDLAGDPSFGEVLTRVRSTVLDAFAHRHMPFEQVVDAVQPDRSQAHTPVFQVLFAYIDAPAEIVRLPDVDMTWWAPARASAQFDLGLSLQRTDDGLVGELEFRTALFDRVSAERIAARFGAVLDAVLDDVDRRLSQLPLLTADEARRLCSWNDTAAKLPLPVAARPTLPSLIAAQAAATPDAVALVYEDETLTYAALMATSARLAGHLRSLGVGPEVLVGICAERSLDLLIGLVAVLRAGGAYVPLDPTYPRERLAAMIEDAEPAAILVHDHLRDRLPLDTATRVSLDEHAAWRTAPARVDGLDQADPDSLAYAIFTSGSTGRPKGVMNRHRGIANRLLWMKAAYGLTADDRFLQKTPFSFDVSVWELFAPLITGGRLVIAPPEAHKDSQQIARLIDAAGATIVHFVPSMLQAFLREPDLDARCSSVRLTICSGEALPIDLVERFAARLPAVRLDNLYGPTEAAVEVTAWPCAEADDDRIVPIGRPIANTRIHILEPSLAEAPVGVAGELFIGGVQVARGYLARPGLTAERFVPDPFAGPGDPGARLYATGDRARWRGDGTVEYLGRIDFQVKLRGLRIELGEIESVLTRHPAVHEAVVASRPTPTGDQLVAYLTMRDDEADGSPSDDDALRGHLATHLPAYMVPWAFLRLDAMPLSPNGKVDRRALGRLPLPVVGGAREHRTPRTPLEAEIAALWSAVLGRDADADAPGVDDDFFALGGHSLLATQLAGRLRSAFGVTLPLRTLFEQPTIAGLAAAVEAARAEPVMTAPPVLEARADEGPAPLSFAQEQLWLADQVLGANAAYNMHGALMLEGPFDPDRLRHALEVIVERHEALRTVFRAVDGVPRAHVVPAAPIDLVVDAWQHLDPETQRTELAGLRHREASWHFDLAAGPLLRVRVVRLAAERHVLLLTMHHIVSDGWSLGVLQAELMAFYRDHQRPRGEQAVPDLPVHYRDYARWQRDWLTRETLAAPLAVWRERLGTTHPRIRWPRAVPRTAASADETRGGLHTWCLDAARTRRLAALAEASGTTLFVALVTAFQGLVHRYTGAVDVRLGAPVANRRPSEVEGLIGCFVNLLVLRGDWTGRPSFRSALERMHDVVVAAQDHQDVPYEVLVAELNAGRDADAGLVNAVLAFQHAAPALGLPGIAVERLPAVSAQAKFDLSLHAEVSDDGLTIDLEFRLAALDAETVARLVEHLERLIDGVLADPERPIDALPLSSAAELRQVLETWNETEALPARDATSPSLVERILQQAARRPDAVAVSWSAGTLTYGALAQRSAAVADRLAGLGVGPGDVVALCVGRSPALVVTQLGVWRVGAAYAPLDPAQPAQRLHYMIDDAEAKVVVGREADLPSFDDVQSATEGDRPVVTVTDEGVVAGGEGDGSGHGGLSSPRNPDALAYVIYTSGSTGRPKGVEIDQRAVESLIDWHVRAYTLGAGDCGTLIANPAFDASVWETWPNLVVGARLVIPDDDVRVAPPRLATWLAEAGVTVGFLPVALAEAVLDESVPEAAPLRAVLTGGDRVRRRPMTDQRWALINHYGPTENSVVSTVATVEPAAATARPAEAGPPSIGGPIDGRQVYVVDAALRPLPIGVEGELLVGGIGVARGYRGRPALTAAAFVPDPWGPPGSRLYRTGDRVRWRADGRLDFVGRADHQVQLHGVRIELAEIEAVLIEEADATEAVAVVRRTATGAPWLVAYVAGPEAPTIDAERLRRSLGKRLPAAMVPAVIMPLDALPRTDNGKIDRQALPTPNAPVHEDATPVGREETRLAAIYAEVLGLERVGRHDDFFALGGHSLLATQAAARIRDALGIDLELRTVLEHPTVAGLAAALAASDRSDIDSRAALTPVDRSQPLVLSYAQERIWVLERLEPGTAAYAMPTALRLRGTLDRSALRSALDTLIARHESLRTVFRATDGVPHQVVLPAAPMALAETDLRALGGTQRDDEAARLRAAHGRMVFDLEHGPLLAAHLVRRADTEWELLLNVHHLVFDGWSFGIFCQELGACYRAFVEGASSPLATPTLHYADYAAWQRRMLDDTERDRQLGYWRGRLAGTPMGTDLPTDRPRPAVRTFAGAHRAGTVSAAVRRQLEALGQAQGATLFMVLLAGFKAVLHRLAGQDDILVGTPVAGRTRQELEGLIGVFLNSLVLRTDVGGNPSFAALVDRVRETTLGAYAHQDVPFEMLIEALATERDPSRTPFFQVFFNMLDLPTETLELVGLDLEPVTVPEAGAKFDLTVYAARTDDGVRFDVVYNADLFDDARIAALIEAYGRFLEAVAADHDVAIGTVSLAGPREAACLPDPRASLDDTWHGSVATAFARHAAAAPDRVALDDASGVWTYGELAAHVRALAADLIASGVRREDVVAIYAHRSPALVVAMLAVAEAGGAFLMLDPAYPTARLTAILDRAQPVAWLELAAAGPVPDDLDAYLEGLSGCARLVLPPLSPNAPAAPEASGPPVEVGPDDRALLAFTSGSTGEPKGIEGRHGPLTHFLPWHLATFDLGVEDRYSLLSGLAHDPLQRDVFTALASGATLCIPDQDRMFEPGYLAAWMRAAGVTVAHMTPAIGQVLAEPPVVGAPVTVPELRLAMLVGDALTQRDVAQLRERAPEVRVINLYGSTETQRAVSWHDGTTEGDAESRQVLPLGRGMKDVQLLVVNPEGAQAAIGELGEIWVRSPHLARGYLADAERTNDRFRTNPFTERAGDRVYRTGDLGRYRADGEVTFAGRADLQVKIRGFRVELGEIEAQLLGHLQVASAAVVVRGSARRLIAFVAGVDGTSPDRAALREHLSAQLPAYMVPSAIVVLDALPLNPNGKLDRRALPEPSAEDLGDDVVRYVAPRTDTERALTEVWARVLGHETVGIHDNFFSLGGDSLLAIRMVSQAHRRRLEVDAKLVFQYQTVEALAPHIRPVIGETEGNDAPIDGPVPLTQVQRRFFEEVLAGAPDQVHHFNIDRLVAVPPDFDVDRLASALRRVLRRHDALALHIEAPDTRGWTGEGSAGMLRQVRVDPDDAGLDVQIVDLSAVPATARHRAVEVEAARCQRSLDLYAGPLVRACVFTFGSDEFARLLLVAHHLLADAYSLVIIQEEVAIAYGQLTRDEPLALPARTTPFTAWAARLDAHVASGALADEHAYWLDQPWSSARRPPADAPDAAMPIHGMRGHVASLDAEATTVLLHRAPALARGAGPNEVVLTALARAARTWDPEGASDRPLHVDIIGHGRDPFLPGADLSRTVGWLAVIFPFLVAVDDEDPLAALRGVRDRVLAVPHGGIGFGLLRFMGDDPALRRALDESVPRAGLMLNFFSSLGAHDREAATEGMVPAPERAGPRLDMGLPLLYPLMLTCNVADGQLHLRWGYSSHRYEKETVEAMAADVQRELEALAARCA